MITIPDPDVTTPTTVSPDWDSLRARFPVVEKKTYLNSCSYGALATDVQASFHRYIDDRLEKGARWEHWVERNDSVRNSVARLIGASPDEVAVTTSASAGINSIASALDFRQERNKVVISDLEFPTNAQIWYAQEQRGAEVVRVPAENGYVPIERFAEAIDDRTLIAAVTHVSFRNGAKLDIPAIAAIARERGALMLVDGYQSLGTLPFDVRAVDVDILAGGMVKYLLGTAGIGFLYVRGALVQQLVPSITGWFAQADIFAMNTTSYDPAPTARRFEMGTPPVPNCYAAEAGLQIVNEIGLAAIEKRIAEITTQIIEEAGRAGYTLAMPAETDRHGALVSLRSTDDNELVARLEADDIVTSCRFGNLRISPHFYNNVADVDELFRALRKQRHLLA